MNPIKQIGHRSSRTGFSRSTQLDLGRQRECCLGDSRALSSSRWPKSYPLLVYLRCEESLLAETAAKDIWLDHLGRLRVACGKDGLFWLAGQLVAFDLGNFESSWVGKWWSNFAIVEIKWNCKTDEINSMKSKMKLAPLTEENKFSATNFLIAPGSRRRRSNWRAQL